MQINKIMQTQNNVTTFQANVNLKNMKDLKLTPKQILAINNTGKQVNLCDKIDISLLDETYKIVTDELLPYSKIQGAIEYLFTGKNGQHKYVGEYSRIEPSMDEKRDVVTERIVKFLDSFKAE